jgi:RHS repeat-associated protein
VGGTAQTYFLWDGQNLLAELNGAGTGEVAEYSYNGVDDPHALVVGGHAYFAHEDMIGSVVALTDSAKQLQRSFAFDAWGNLSTGNDYLPFNNADRARWKGALWLGPEVDLYYMRNRWYEPLTGRFLSEDPDGLRGGFNLYTYGYNDPVNMRDPNGLCPEGTHPTGRIKLIKGAVYEECVDGNGATSWSPQTVELPPVTVPANPPPIVMPRPPTIADPSLPAPVVGVGVPGSPAPTPAIGPRSPNQCSLSNFLAAAKAGAKVMSKVGMYYGAVIGSVAGYTGGAVTGAALGEVLGAPSVIGAIAGPVGGFVGGGLEGAYWGGLAGTISGTALGGVVGFTGGWVGGIVQGCGL